MRKTIYCWSLVVLYFLSSCKTGPGTEQSDQLQVDNHPAWIMQGNIYEVNLRQYTAEGTFNAFADHLPRLKDMGVQTLWFMPIHPISQKDRKGALGSYYAIANYRAVNPEYGSMEDWQNLVEKAHDLGLRVIIDWVPNHSGADHAWLTTNPDFYVKDSSGKPVSPFDWTDVRKLDYTNAALADSMTAAMKFWITETGIDGFRVDVAGEVKREFYEKAIPELKRTKNIFLLAEAEQPWLHEVGFDATYAWSSFHMMKRIAAGERNAAALDSTVILGDQSYPSNALRLYFTSNHDENSWNKADHGTMPGASHAPFAVLTQTLPRGVPLIYSGQEEPVKDSISFFYKDAIEFGRFERAPFYKTLLELRKRNEALSANASFTRLVTDKEAQVYAFLRQKNGRKVLVVTNLSGQPVNFTISNASVGGEATNVFDKSVLEISPGGKMQLPAWGYGIYEYR